MKLAGIIAEYDPFHNGHAWQLAQARALGAERVAVAMSCGLTQRGALPLLPEVVRVRAALTCGADFVFALPAPCAGAGAEAFARAGVRLLSAAGCDTLVFGAETPDAALLMQAARVLLCADYRAALKAQLSDGARNFAAARQAAVEALCPGTPLAALLDKPNNNLAVEYCKAILELARAQTTGRNWPRTLSGLPAPAPCGRSGRPAGRTPWPVMCPKLSFPSTGKPSPPGSTPILTQRAAASWPCSAPAAWGRRRLLPCGAFRRVWNTGWNGPCGPAPPTKSCWTP